ncbi:hypothetical protein F5X99DRAFT_410695 [Biscogniauxia marginata]|nr:hypothetical protein F5X99DRAFT_410695 [Biscogniauxia marginata]
MTRFFNFAASSLILLQSLVAASPLACLNGICPYTRTNLTVDIVAQELGPQLSNTSNIFGPSDSRWADATARYQDYNKPNIQLVVEPGREEDIPKIVRYANSNSLGFLTVNRGHSLFGDMGKFTGIQISMELLTKITINEGGETAWFQGGTYDQQVIDELFEQGYVATTGSCSCVGMMGPGLGGGHGRYQGRYGMISDNLVTINVVLANGTAIIVSEQSNPDLLWAMKGAGHNFGIVTSFELKIYPKLVDTWYYKNYVWTQDKLETVFEEINKFHNNGSEPVDMAYEVGVYMMDPTISETEGVIWWSFAYSGSQEDAQQYLTPFDNIEAARIVDGNVPYPKIPGSTGSGLEDSICDPGYSRMNAQAGTFVWNVTTQRQIYELFNQKIREQPALNGSLINMEGYSTAGVKAVDADTSGFPWRNAYNHLGFITISYPPDTSLDEFAIEWKTQTRDLWNQGQPGRLPTTYVNYAWGDEPIESVYGYEPWRLEKLRSLKAQYDPYGRFSYYNPITPA